MGAFRSMAVLAIVTSSPPDTEGGHLVIARSLVNAARACGHDARLVVTPDYGIGRQIPSYLANWFTDIDRKAGAHVDQVISLRTPSYAVRHAAHVCWLNHTIREYYDLWPRYWAVLSRRARVRESMRRAAIHATDRWLLTRNVTRVVAQSRTIHDRLAKELTIQSDVVLPPPPPRAYRSEGYGDFVLAVSRLTPLKRVDLLLRALAEPAARHVRARIVGEGVEAQNLNRLAGTLGVADRVTFLGRVADETLIAQLADCRAVCFTPFDEDYGFVTAEAFASRKAVITCSDSGGPTELVRDGVSGLVCQPTPSALAAALARVTDDRSFAERLGTAAGVQAASMAWPAALERLLVV
jgi:glycosyltransferase involved in cell wall biosynthesis